MARIKAVLLLLAAILVVSTWVPISHCAKKTAAGARKEDIPFIKCQVCEKLASQLYHQVQKKQAQISPRKAVSEYEIIGIAENVCNLKKEEADWILRIDIVEQGDKLELVEQNDEGQCNSECKTIERACQEVLGYSDIDVAEYIYTSKPDIESLVNYLCKDLSKACRTKPPPIPKDRKPGEPFEPKPAKEAEMERIMRSMQDMPGAPGMQMYSREDLMNMKNFGGEDAGDDDDDDDDDEANFPKNLGRVLKDKESKNGDWQQRITKGILHTGEILKKKANKFLNNVRPWWTGIKAARSKKSKASKSEL